MNIEIAGELLKAADRQKPRQIERSPIFMLPWHQRVSRRANSTMSGGFSSKLAISTGMARTISRRVASAPPRSGRATG